MKKKILFLTVVLTVFLSSCEKNKITTDLVDFEDLAVNGDGIWNGSAGEEGFESGNVFFSNIYDSQYDSWSGFAYSNHTDIYTAEYSNQYSSIAGSGAEQSSKYGVFFSWTKDTLVFLRPEKVTNISVSNSTYAYRVMESGNDFAKKFGGEDGTDQDWYTLTLTGIDESGQPAGSLEIYLADFRFTDPQMDYISNVWNHISLEWMGFISKLVFTVASSDVGLYGINTPTYVCLDNIEGQLLPLE